MNLHPAAPPTVTPAASGRRSKVNVKKAVRSGESLILAVVVPSRYVTLRTTGRPFVAMFWKSTEVSKRRHSRCIYSQRTDVVWMFSPARRSGAVFHRPPWVPASVQLLWSRCAGSCGRRAPGAAAVIDFNRRRDGRPFEKPVSRVFTRTSRGRRIPTRKY